MDHFNKIKGHVSGLMGTSRNKPPPDDLMVSCRTQLKDLQDEIVQVKKQFTHYAHQVVEAAEASVTLSKSVGAFYAKANHPGRMESVNTYQKVQEEIANRAVNTFHITVENGLIAELAEWNSLVQKHLENIRVAEGTRTTAHDTANRLHSLQNEYTEKKNKKKVGMFGGNREQEMEDLQQRIAKASDVRKSLTAEYQKQKNSIAQAVKQLMEKRYIYFDRIYVQMLECQAEYFTHAATVSKRFQRDIDYYRKQYPKQNEFQHSNGSASGSFGSNNSKPRPQSNGTVNEDSSKVSKSKKSKKAMVDFDGSSPPMPPKNAPPDVPHMNGYNNIGGGSSMDTSSSPSPAQSPPKPKVVPLPENSTINNGKKSQSVPDSTSSTIDVPKHNKQARQPSMHEHDLLFGGSSMDDVPQTQIKSNHSGNESFMNSMFGSEVNIHDEDNLLDIGNPNANDMLFQPSSNQPSGSQTGSIQRDEEPDVKSHGDIWGDFHSGNSPPVDQPEANTAQSAHSFGDFDFLVGSGQPPNPRQRSKTESATQSQRNGQRMVQSKSSKTPPVGSIAQEDPMSQEDKKQMAGMKLSEKGKARARKVYEEEMKRREAEEKKEEQERLERIHWKDTHENKLKAWEFDNTVRRNVRTLIGKLPDVLPPELTDNPKINWKPIPISKLLNDSQLKRGYFKAIRVVHPDKSSQRGDSIEAQVICDYVFQALEQAYKTQFN